MSTPELDVAVVGSGHNALIGAAYLAARGRRISVFEADTVPGGAVSTVERFPGYRVDRGSSAHLMFRHTGIAEELALADHGLRYLDCDPWAFVPTPPGTSLPPIVFRVDLDATAESIAAACGAREAAAYRRFVADWAPRARATMTAFGAGPTAARLGRAFWPTKGSDSVAGLSRSYLASGDALLDEYFDDERLKAALAWFGAQSGPAMSEPGTAPMVGFAALMHTVPPGRAVGGSGALTSALISRIESGGGTVELGTPVTALRRAGRGWRVTVTGPDGTRTVSARTVLAGCHVLTTLDLLGRGGYPGERIDRWRRRIQVGPGVGMVVRLGTTAPPEFDGLTLADQSGLGLLTADRGHLARARGDMLAADPPRRPAVLAMTFSGLDPSIAPAGRHNTTLWAQWYPYTLTRDDWPAIAEAEADRIVAETQRWAPGFADTIEHRYVQTPANLESELGLIGGNVMHVEMALHNMLLFRPLPELAGGRVPGAPGLALAGASMHPGGGVNGSSGRIAARLLARDLRGLARWRS
ncbi:Pyridine nucleotide-disulfide oxidoreductase domain-containing protein 2 OS=Tsukamurella paurometabola(strain ATCC 8368 / DSM / CCUG 35730 / CIP 100753/ JCM 10117 / KCTC 9821 / NBRC 16120 / NCIMB 702349 / NCTC 13040) OX=521096 GN=Tpau_2659 PE=4 SV=1 [Tsukamurella paurometabola]|uniref:Pyridine nucleotide-disulfide oxidoreductase domain-containing protein 2 n=1 Tax=Tsukamurella paurometabola (strain ATCC 8368 / DSM 20162 / CCUG 35730 / CIP 100753 / JCM 10117 / KCTC 9821 / NBRC 16120 / NCIMB 702349 / NCTC 13040) TaxID=521096 RepID=D5USI8_TSUPD|nr:NAD(P)/FAD-dependent oxidoreductase [Tsukamurella paurometabola]ADG79259.1 beta-carotene ketolase [Tsukamurella paurometabola DSM 20162]SUP34802.1 Protoporphyrinogen oxidase [Tsukamurella paurometabola]